MIPMASHVTGYMRNASTRSVRQCHRARHQPGHGDLATGQSGSDQRSPPAPATPAVDSLNGPIPIKRKQHESGRRSHGAGSQSVDRDHAHPHRRKQEACFRSGHLFPPPRCARWRGFCGSARSPAGTFCTSMKTHLARPEPSASQSRRTTAADGGLRNDRPPPMFGQHNEETISTELGYGKDDLTRFKAEKVI